MSTTKKVDWKLEAVVIPVSDVERAKGFYSGLGWRLDADFAKGNDFRIVQFTPPGSPCSIHFGKGIAPATPGSAHLLVVSEIVKARTDLVDRGVDVGEVFHNGAQGLEKGVDPKRSSYASFTSFGDPDGNRWLLQEVTARLPGRVDASVTTFASPAELGAALRRAAAAHGEHEKRNGGQHDAGWPDWYAEYMVQEQAGKPLPS